MRANQTPYELCEAIRAEFRPAFQALRVKHEGEVARLWVRRDEALARMALTSNVITGKSAMLAEPYLSPAEREFLEGAHAGRL